MATRTQAPQRPVVARSPQGGMGLAPAAPAPQPTADLLRLAIGSNNISVDIPSTATLVEAEQSLGLAVLGYQKLAEASEKLKPIVGRILLVISSRKLYRPDYKNFTEYVTNKVVRGMGFSRSNAFEALKIARAFPQMTSEEYQKYGSSRLLLAATITDQTRADHVEVLAESTRVTVEEFREKVKAQTLRRSNETAKQMLSIRLPVEEREAFMQLSESLQLPTADLLITLVRFFTDNGGPEAYTAPPPAAA